MAKRTPSPSKRKTRKATGKATSVRKPAAKATPSKASTSRKALAKKAARAKAVKAAKIAVRTATVNYEPAPFESVADHNPSKAPGKQHRHPPKNVAGVQHSDETIAKARTKSMWQTKMVG
ncbi:MAG: hypothetical protein WCQ64_13965 [Acidobacteriota bacterium]